MWLRAAVLEKVMYLCPGITPRVGTLKRNTLFTFQNDPCANFIYKTPFILYKLNVLNTEDKHVKICVDLKFLKAVKKNPTLSICVFKTTTQGVLQ